MDFQQHQDAKGGYRSTRLLNWTITIASKKLSFFFLKMHTEEEHTTLVKDWPAERLQSLFYLGAFFLNEASCIVSRQHNTTTGSLL